MSHQAKATVAVRPPAFNSDGRSDVGLHDDTGPVVGGQHRHRVVSPRRHKRNPAMFTTTHKSNSYSGCSKIKTERED